MIPSDLECSAKSYAFRCAKCWKMQPEGSTMVYVPDNYPQSMGYWAGKSGWCERCASGLVKRWWQFWKW